MNHARTVRSTRHWWQRYEEDPMPDTDIVARFRLAFLYGEAASQTIKQWGIYAVVLELPGQKLKVYIGSGTTL